MAFYQWLSLVEMIAPRFGNCKRFNEFHESRV